MRWRAIREAVRQRAEHHENYYAASKLGHTIKAIVCIVLGRRKSLWSAPDCYDSVAVWGFSRHAWPGCDCGGNGCDWTELSVGYGWKNWHFDIYRNSSC